MASNDLPPQRPDDGSNRLPAEYSYQPIEGVGAPAPGGWDDLDEDESLDWRRYLHAVYRNKILVLCGLGLGLIAAVISYQMIEPTYQVNATVWIERDEGSRPGDPVPIRPSQLLNEGGWVDLMRSFAVLDPVVDDLRLYVQPASPAPRSWFDDFELGEELRPGRYALRPSASGNGEWSLIGSEGDVLERVRPGGVVGASRGFRWTVPPNGVLPDDEIVFSVRNPREAARALSQELTISARGTFLRVALEGTDPEHITKVINGVMERYVVVAAELKRAHLDERTTILEEQVAYAADNLAEAEFELERFKVQTISLPSEQGTPVAPGLQQTQNPVFQNFFNLKLEQEEARRDQIAIERAMQSSGQQGRLAVEALEVIPSVRASSDLMSALGLASDKRAELRALSLRYTDDHPSVIELRDDLADLEQRTIPGLVQTLLSEVQARQQEIDGFVSRASVELQQIPPRAVEETRLERQFESAQNLFQDLQNRYETTRLGAASTVPDVRILDRAQVPESPSTDQRTRFLGVALLAGLALGLLGAILRDRIDPVLRRPNQVSRDLGLPILATIPHARSKNGRLREEDHDQVVEAFRNLRLGVSYANRKGHPLVVTVSSPGIGDGKSFTSSNLALAFAEQGQRTLVIDGDVRRGTLHGIFGEERKPGLTDFLAGDHTLEEIVRPIGDEHLWVITSGSRFRDGPELLGTPPMQALVKDLRERFDVILIDSPPLGAAVDAYMLGTLSGSLLLVMRNGSTDQEVAQARLDELERFPIDILGAVLNDVPIGSSLYKQYSYLPGYGVADEEVRPQRPKRLAGKA